MLRKPDLDKPVFRLFKKERLLIECGLCPVCENSIENSEFRDKKSVKEYSVSGMCQHCQDIMFSSF